MIGQKTYEELLEQIPFWGFLTAEERALAMRRKTIVSHAAGHVVCDGGSDCLGMILVLSGILRAYLLSPEGKEITLYRIREGEACVMAAACVLHSISFETHIEAECDSELLIIPVDIYSGILNQNVQVKAITYEMAAQRFSDVVAAMERLVFFSLEQRLASFLLDEAAQTGADTLHMTHEQIAVSIGSAREVVSRSLKSLADQGLVELFRGGVRIKERPSLYRIVSS